MKIRQEINITSSIFTLGINSSTNDIVQLDTTQYSGTPTYWFEVSTNGSGTGGVNLRRSGTTTDDATLSISAAGIFRTQFTPPAGATEYVVFCPTGTSTNSILNSRIIVLQDEGAISKTETQIEISSSTTANNTAVADITNPKFWTYTSANWDGTKTFSVEVVWKTSAKNTVTITLCRTSDNAANVTVVSAGTNSTGYVRTRVTFTPVNGETYKLRAVGSTTKSNYLIANGKIIVDQSSSPTKLEPQFILAPCFISNTINAALGTLTTWKASEWDAGTGSITYKHAIDSNNASNSAKLRDVTANADIANSTVTGTGQQVSASVSFTDTNNLDLWQIASPGQIAASRIIVTYAWVAVVLPEIITLPLTLPSRSLFR